MLTHPAGNVDQPELPEQPASQQEADETTWAKNQVELAKALGCTRRTVARYLKTRDSPGATSDGRYNITTWKMWVADHGHLRTRAGSDKESLEMRGLRLKNEELEMRVAQQRGELNSVEETCNVLTALMGTMVSRFTSLKHELAPQVVGETVPEATKRLGAAFTEVFSELSLADWAKKKAFWQTVSRHLCDLQARHCPTIGR